MEQGIINSPKRKRQRSFFELVPKDPHSNVSIKIKELESFINQAGGLPFQPGARDMLKELYSLARSTMDALFAILSKNHGTTWEELKTFASKGELPSLTQLILKALVIETVEKQKDELKLIVQEELTQTLKSEGKISVVC